MKIGTIRRIDDLGRVVIPKTVRKAMNIKTGDNLEIYIESEKIILRKHSEMGKISEIGIVISKVLSEKINAEVYITDRDRIILKEKTIENQNICRELQDIIENRSEVKKDKIKITDKITIDGSIIICPVVTNGDVVGSIIVRKKESINKEELEVIKSFKLLLSKLLEE